MITLVVNFITMYLKKKLHHKNIDKVNRSLRGSTQQLKARNSEIIFFEKNLKDFKTEINMEEIKHLRVASCSLRKGIEQSLKALDILK